MTPADRDDPEVENDPTGVRALLSSLPEPGPMPDELVSRITASLAAEQERREEREHGFGHHQDPGTISLAAQRHRRRPGRALSLLGAAAAVAVGATVVSTQLFGGTGDTGVTSQFPDAAGGAQSESGDGAPGPDDGGQDGSGQAQDEGLSDDESFADPPAAQEDGDDGSLGPHGEGTEEGQADGTADGELAAPQVLAETHVLPSGDRLGPSIAALLAGDPAIGDGVLSTEEAAACLESLGTELPAQARTLVAAVTVEADPAILVVQVEPEPQLGWLLDTACTEGRPAEPQGPTLIG